MSGRDRFAEVLDRLPAAVALFRGPDLVPEYANRRQRSLGSDAVPLDLLREARDSGQARHVAEAELGGGFWDLAILPVPEEDLVVVHAVEVGRQLAVRRRAEEAERRYRAFVDSNVVGVTVTGEEEVVEANDAFLDMLGYTRADLERGLKWPELSAPEYREADERAMRLLREQGVAPPFEKAYLRRDGGRAEVLMSGTRISEDPLRVLATVYDLTERRAADREIRAVLERERHARLAAELAHARTRRLQELTGSLSATLSTAEMARVVVTHALEDLSASAGSLSRLEGGDVRVEYAIGYPPEVVDMWRRFPLAHDTPITEAIRTRRPVLLLDASAWERHSDREGRGATGSAVALPLLVRDDPIGALALDFDEHRSVAPADLDFLAALAQQAATAIERAELFENRAYVARKLQEGLLPRRLEPVPGMESAVRYSSISGGGEVGGDFYDVFAAGADRWTVAVGDVCGKGTDAAVVTGLARHTVRAVARVWPEPADVLEFLNDALRRHDGAPAFCTVLCATLRTRPAGRFVARIASGGHPVPLVLRAGGDVEEVSVTGTMLGVAPDPTLHPVDVDLGPGDALLAYTDGVIDARMPGGQRFGEQRLLDVLRAAAGRDADGIASAVEAAVRRHDPGPPADDRAIVVLRVAP